MARIPSQRRVDPIGTTPITDAGGVATPFYARQWQNLIELVKSVLVLQDDSETNAARITVNESKIATLEATEIGGDNIDIQPAPAPLSAGNITLNLSDTTVTPGTYGDATNSPQITVDQKGRITGIVDVPISGGGGGGAAWTLVNTTVIAVGTASVDVTGLGAYDELLVILDDSTSSVSQGRMLRVSIDNGVSFLSSTADYLAMAESGARSGSVGMFATSATTGARSCYWQILDKNSATDPKLSTNNSASQYLIRTPSAIDAIQVRNGVSGTLDSGTVYVFGR